MSGVLTLYSQSKLNFLLAQISLLLLKVGLYYSWHNVYIQKQNHKSLVVDSYLLWVITISYTERIWRFVDRAKEKERQLAHERENAKSISLTNCTLDIKIKISKLTDEGSFNLHKSMIVNLLVPHTLFHVLLVHSILQNNNKVWNVQAGSTFHPSNARTIGTMLLIIKMEIDGALSWLLYPGCLHRAQKSNDGEEGSNQICQLLPMQKKKLISLWAFSLSNQWEYWCRLYHLRRENGAPAICISIQLEIGQRSNKKSQGRTRQELRWDYKTAKSENGLKWEWWQKDRGQIRGC